MNKKDNISKLLLIVLMFSVFLDVANFFMPLPIFSPLFLGGKHYLEFSLNDRKLLLGFLMGLYGLAQLIGGPLLGHISDRTSRKKLLVVSLALSFFSTLLSGYSLHLGSIVLIYVSRLLLGLSSATIALAFTIASDLSNDESRAKNIGYITIGTSLGAILGPGIGGYFTKSSNIAIFGNSTPFYFMSILYLIAIAMVFISLKSIYDNKQKDINNNKITKILGNLQCQKKYLFSILIIILLFQLSCESFYLASPIIATIKFRMLPFEISNYFIIQGIVAIFTSLMINKQLSKILTSTSIIKINFIMLLICYLFLSITTSRILFTIPFIGVGIFGTLCWIHTNCVLSKTVSSTNQGVIFGISQAVWGIASSIGPIAVGIAAAFFGHEFASFVPILLISCSFLLILMMPSLIKKNTSINQRTESIICVD